METSKIVMDRLRCLDTALTESLEPEVTERLLNELFPMRETHESEVAWQNWNEYDPGHRVIAEEMKEAVRRRRRGGCPAPGPDGLSLTIRRCALNCVAEYLSSIYMLCLEKGKILRAWKKAILVLILKGKVDMYSP